jgi:hypothetical protein
MDHIGILFVLAMMFPIWMIMRDARERSGARYWQRVGVVVCNEQALDSVAEVIGCYMGANIYCSLVFRGVRYEYDRVALPGYKDVLRGRELYLEPGVIYVVH